jgi:hypothetical protein
LSLSGSPEDQWFLDGLSFGVAAEDRILVTHESNSRKVMDDGKLGDAAARDVDNDASLMACRTEPIRPELRGSLDRLYVPYHQDGHVPGTPSPDGDRDDRDRETEPLTGLKFDRKSPDGLGKEAFKAPCVASSGSAARS